MKKLITMLVLIFTVPTFADTTEAVTNNNSETERIIDKYDGKIIESFNKMIETATPYAEKGFKLVVKLQIAKGVTYLFFSLLTILMWLMFRKGYKKVELTPDGNKYGPMSCYAVTPWLIASFVSSVILTIAFPFVTYWGMLYVIVPEWFAIKEIISLF